MVQMCWTDIHNNTVCTSTLCSIYSLYLWHHQCVRWKTQKGWKVSLCPIAWQHCPKNGNNYKNKKMLYAYIVKTTYQNRPVCCLFLSVGTCSYWVNNRCHTCLVTWCAWPGLHFARATESRVEMVTVSLARPSMLNSCRNRQWASARFLKLTKNLHPHPLPFVE